MARTTQHIDDFPAELLGFVFRLANDDALASHRTGLPLPHAISSTCSSWRDVSLSLPQLWSTIRISRPSREALDGKARLLDMYLDRSGNHDLDVYLDFSELGDRTLQVEDMIASVAEHAGRLKAFTALADDCDEEPLRMFCKAVANDAPTIRLSSTRTRSTRAARGAATQQEPCGVYCPRLRYIRICEISIAIPQLYSLCSRLTQFCFEPGDRHINLDEGGPGDVPLLSLFIAALCLPSIETISFWTRKGCSPFEDSPFPDVDRLKPVKAKQLKHIRIGGHSHFILAFIFLRLAAPLLKTMVVQSTPLCRPDEPPGYATDFPSDSYPDYVFPSLEELSLVNLQHMYHMGTMAFEGYTNGERLWRVITGRTRNVTRLVLNTPITWVQAIFNPVQANYASHTHPFLLRQWPSITHLFIPSFHDGTLVHPPDNWSRQNEVVLLRNDAGKRLPDWPPGFRSEGGDRSDCPFLRDEVKQRIWCSLGPY